MIEMPRASSTAPGWRRSLGPSTPSGQSQSGPGVMRPWPKSREMQWMGVSSCQRLRR